ncbi:MAG TPA: hypothetical protein VFT74_10700 [Isosphaeraceae bacterium]|nr:hypothetical protein [Isosphaeraceae bacterium]
MSVTPAQLLKRVSWKEPPGFLPALEGRPTPVPSIWPTLGSLAGTAGVLVLAAYIYGRPIAGSWGATTAGAFGVGLVVAFLLPMLNPQELSIIQLDDSGIGRRTVRRTQVVTDHWPWDRIDSCSVQTVALADNLFPAMVLRDSEGKTLVLGLARGVLLSDLETALSLRGKPMIREMGPSYHP